MAVNEDIVPSVILNGGRFLLCEMRNDVITAETTRYKYVTVAIGYDFLAMGESMQQFQPKPNKLMYLINMH